MTFDWLRITFALQLSRLVVQSSSHYWLLPEVFESEESGFVFSSGPLQLFPIVD